MKLSLRWLNDHVDLAGLAPDEIARQLTMKTALIEGVERPGAGLEKVRVGHVLHREKHPNADRLSFCKVEAGEGLVEVVCGAPNVAAGQKIAYAPVGATLPNGLTLEARKIRGITSHGMICSQQELGLGEDHDGIIVLPEDAPVGAPLAQYLGLDDVVFEIDNKSVTHRADLWGHFGFARELAAIFERELRPLAVDTSLRPDPASFPIRVDDPVGCPLYLALRVEFDALPATPEWMKQRLTAAGMRPIALLVDLSNYVMLEIGQPTHPFDEAQLAGGRIVVRRALAGEKLTTLDGQARDLAPEDLVIADGTRVIALAGVMGGRETEVADGTRRMLLESAGFEGVRVRKTAARLGLRTEAVARFEKSLDPALPELALRRYAHLLRQIAPGVRVRTGFAAAGGSHPKTPTLTLRPDRARTKLGYALPTDEMNRRLVALGFEVRSEGDRLLVTVPTFRARRDITCEDDLIEEVGRTAGYERVPATLPKLDCRPPVRDPVRQLEHAATRVLTLECGYCEALGYSFATDRQIERYLAQRDADAADAAGAPAEPFVKLLNSLTQDASRLRRSLVPGLLEFVAKNLIEQDDVRLVETGREYLPERAAEGHGDGLPYERRVLAAVQARKWAGQTGASEAQRKADPETLLLEARADVERLFARLRIPWEGRRPTGALPPFVHPGRCIELVCRGSGVGLLAQLHPELARRFDITAPAVVLELDLARLAALPRPAARMTPIPQYPPALRDLAVEASDDKCVADVAAEIRQAGGERLTLVDLFDVYRGPTIAPGHRSLAFRLEYRAPDRTLTDEEVDKIHKNVVERLARQGVKLRA